MRNDILLLTALFIFNSCVSNHNYKVEDALMECFKDQYQQIGIDITKSIDSANAVFLDFNVLSEIEGRSFISLIEGIKDSSGLPFEPTPELIESLENIKRIPLSISCRDSAFFDFDSTDLYNSKFSSFVAIFDSIGRRGEISVEMIANDFLVAFNESDFDHPLYSTLGTLILTHMIKTRNDRGILDMLPPPTEEGIKRLESQKILEISMIEGDKVLIDGEEVEQNNIFNYTQEFIEKNHRFGFVKIMAHRAVSYELYTNVIDDVKSAYDNYREIKSLEIYGANFENLSLEQKQEIKLKYPKSITISEPER